MTGIKNYRTNASLNGTVFATGTASEGMSPSQVNDTMRQMAKDTKDWYLNAEWIEFGDGETAITPTRISGTEIGINANVIDAYHSGRRIKLIDGTGTTLYGTIASSNFVSPTTTITISWDSGSIGSGTITMVALGITSATNSSMPTNIPTGGIILWTQSSIPSGFLLADGSLVNKVTYSALFSALGNTYGTATSTQFYLPDLKDKFVIGKGSTYGLATTGGASSITPSGTNSALSFSGNSFTPSGSVSVSVSNHTLTLSQIPSHSHFVSSSGNGFPNLVQDNSALTMTSKSNGGLGNNDYNLVGVSGQANQSPSQSVGGSGGHNHGASGSFSGNSVTPSGSINTPVFTGNSTSIINPYIALSYIIKT
tara:strand:+ start:5771 stop:6871 length:1101 start_codon:yes stop_codon:yes gene_type:complete